MKIRIIKINMLRITLNNKYEYNKHYQLYIYLIIIKITISISLYYNI